MVELVRAARNLRAEFRIQNNQRLDATVSISNGRSAVFEDARQFIQTQARIDLDVTRMEDVTAGAADTAVQVLESGTLSVSLGGLVDLDEETGRLRAELDQLRKYERRIAKNLSNDNFLRRAPEEVVERERDRLTSTKSRISQLSDILDRLAE